MSDAGNTNSSADPPQAAPKEPSDREVNPQIVDAVAKSTDFVFGLREIKSSSDIKNRLTAGAAIAYEKAAQAGALAIQDATDYQRNIMSISTAAQGKALAIMIADPSKIEQMGIILVLAMASTLVATITSGLVGVEVNNTLKNFPRT